MDLTGMVIPMSPEDADQAEREMARCFMEEYALLGYDDDSILALFRDPFYQFPHRLYRQKGEAVITRWLRETRTPAPETARVLEEVHHGKSL